MAYNPDMHDERSQLVREDEMTAAAPATERPESDDELSPQLVDVLTRMANATQQRASAAHSTTASATASEANVANTATQLFSPTTPGGLSLNVDRTSALALGGLRRIGAPTRGAGAAAHLGATATGATTPRLGAGSAQQASNADTRANQPSNRCIKSSSNFFGPNFFCYTALVIIGIVYVVNWLETMRPDAGSKLSVVLKNSNPTAYNNTPSNLFAGLDIAGLDSSTLIDTNVTLAAPVSVLDGQAFSSDEALVRKSIANAARSLRHQKQVPIFNPEIWLGDLPCDTGCVFSILKQTVSATITMLRKLQLRGITSVELNINGDVMVVAFGDNSKRADATFNVTVIPAEASASATPSVGASPSSTATSTSSSSSTSSSTPSSSATPSSGESKTSTLTPTKTNSPTPSATATFSSTTSQTSSSTNTPSHTHTPSSTASASAILAGLIGHFTLKRLNGCQSLANVASGNPEDGWSGTLGGQSASMNITISDKGGAAVVLSGPPNAFWCDENNVCILPSTSSDEVMKYNYGNVSVCTQSIKNAPIVITGDNTDPSGVPIQVTSYVPPFAHQAQAAATNGDKLSGSEVKPTF